METAIIGLPLSGKTTFFNSITGRGGQAGSRNDRYRDRGKSSNVADAVVPDDRVSRLAQLFRPKRTTPATVRLRDIQIRYSPEEGFTPSTLAELKSCDAITLVIRAFSRYDIPHPLDRIDPAGDLDLLIDSLVYSDYEAAQRRIDRLEKEGRRKEREYIRLERIVTRLEEGRLLGTEFLTEEDRTLFSGFSFLTVKPIFVVANTSPDTDNAAPEWNSGSGVPTKATANGEARIDIESLSSRAHDMNLSYFELQGLAEMEIAQLSPEDQSEFLGDLGLWSTTRERFLSTVYRRLNLISFLTAGEDEVRAWSIREGTAAAGAAGKIHSDLERGFIRAEVVPWEELYHAGGFSQAKTSGKLRLEGRQYVVRDGDVLTILFNVKSRN